MGIRPEFSNMFENATATSELWAFEHVWKLRLSPNDPESEWWNPRNHSGESTLEQSSGKMQLDVKSPSKKIANQSHFKHRTVQVWLLQTQSWKSSKQSPSKFEPVARHFWISRFSVPHYFAVNVAFFKHVLKKKNWVVRRLLWSERPKIFKKILKKATLTAK